MTTAHALSRAQEMRVFWAIVVQPLMAGGVAFLLFPVLLLDRGRETLAGGMVYSIDGALSVAIGAGLVAFVISVFAALPTAVWLIKRRQVSFGEALLFGLGFGNLPFAVGTLTLGTRGVAGFMSGMMFSSLLGLAGAAAFWTIALRQQNVSAAPEAG